MGDLRARNRALAAQAMRMDGGLTTTGPGPSAMEAAAAAEAAARCAAAEARAVNAEAQVLSLRKEVGALQGAQGAAGSHMCQLKYNTLVPKPCYPLPAARGRRQQPISLRPAAGSAWDGVQAYALCRESRKEAAYFTVSPHLAGRCAKAEGSAVVACAEAEEARAAAAKMEADLEGLSGAYTQLESHSFTLEAQLRDARAAAPPSAHDGMLCLCCPPWDS